MVELESCTRGATIRVFKDKDAVEIHDPEMKYCVTLTKLQAKTLADRLLFHLHNEAH